MLEVSKNMIMVWKDLSKSAQENYLNYYGKKHAEWNNIPIKEAKKRILKIIKTTNPLFEVPIVNYEDAR